MPTVIVRMKTKYVSEKVIVLLADQQIIYNSTFKCISSSTSANIEAVKKKMQQWIFCVLTRASLEAIIGSFEVSFSKGLNEKIENKSVC